MKSTGNEFVVTRVCNGCADDGEFGIKNFVEKKTRARTTAENAIQMFYPL